MKRWILRTAQRIDAFTLRERALVFFAVALLIVSILDTGLLRPQLAREKQLSELLAKRQSEVREVQAQLQAVVLARAADPDRENRERLAKVRSALAGLEAQIETERHKFTAPGQMRGMLEEMLARNSRLRLLELKTLEPTTIGSAKAQDAPAPKPQADGVADQLIYRHGVELSLSGTYLDLLSYLAALEKLPSQLYWGKLDLKVEEHPVVTLRLTVYTINLDRAWMRV